MPNRTLRKASRILQLPQFDVEDTTFGGDVSQEIGFLIDLMDLAPENKILDIASGAGQNALELSRRGFDVTAVDLSDQLLEIGKRTAEAHNLAVTWHKGDPRKASFRDEFDAALVLGGGAFGLMETDRENQAILDSAFQMLKPGGRIVVSAASLLWLVRTSPDLSGYDPLTGYLTTQENIQVEGGENEEFPLHERYYVFPGLSRQMESSGFRRIIGFGAAPGRYSSRSITVEDPEILCYGVKPE